MNLPPYGDQFRRTNSHFSSLKVSPSPRPDMFVNISEGGFWLTNKIWKEYVGGRSPGFTAPNNNAKWDLLCLHYNGNPMIIPGVPSTDPVFPNLQRKAFPLAAIYLEAGDTEITSEKIFDLRFFHTTSFSHIDFENRDQIDSHPITAITGLRTELDQIESGNYWSNVLNDKADIDGTPSEKFTLNKDFTGTPSSDCGIIVERGTQPNVEFKFNETIGQWEYTNNGADWVQLTDQGPSVTLPIASSTLLGGIKIGARLLINPISGILDAEIQTSNDFTNAYKSKLDIIEDGATGDMTPLEVKASYESNINTNSFTDAEKIKLAGIEDGANVGVMSDADVKVAYENNSNTNAFTDAEKNKLLTVEASAKDDMTNVEIKASYESNLNTNAFTDVEKVKLSGIESGANAYVHPPSHHPSIIVQDANNRFVSDLEKTMWSNKADPINFWSKSELSSTGGFADRVDWSHIQNAPAFGSSEWLNPVPTSVERDALTNLRSGQCVLVQDDGDGKAAQYIYNGSSWVKIGDVDWTPMTDSQIKTAYENNADTNSFTDAEKSKLGTVEENANAFTLAPATNIDLGGVIIGSGLSIDPSGVVALDYLFDDTTHGVRGGGILHQIADESTGGFMSSADKIKLNGIQTAANLYVLPSASDLILGGVRIGTNLDFMPNGTISVPTAISNNILGLMQVKSTSHLSIDENGGVDVPLASSSVYGAVQVGSNININSGVISVSHAQGASLGLVKVGDNIVLDDITGEISVNWSALPFDDVMHGNRIGGDLHAVSTETTAGFISATDKVKIDGIESGATGDMDASEIKASYESNADTNVFDDAAQTKLAGIEDSATGDMNASEIKASYESNADTNAFTDALQTKLNGIAESANNYLHPTTHPSNIIDQPVTSIIFIDMGRIDSYTEDGSINRPYKSIASAITNAPTGKIVFRIAPNTYSEDIVITDNMHFVTSGRSCQIDGTVLYSTSSGDISSFSGFIINGAGTNPTIQYYGSTTQFLKLDNCIVISAGLQPALHMNNSGAGSILYATHTEFRNTGNGLATLVSNTNKIVHRKCEFIANNNTRSIQYADDSRFSDYMSTFSNQIYITGTASGELYHPIITSGTLPCIQHNGNLLAISAPVDFSTNQILISEDSTGIVKYKTEASAIGFIRDSETTDWLNNHIVVESAIEELLSRIVALESTTPPPEEIEWSNSTEYWTPIDYGVWNSGNSTWDGAILNPVSTFYDVLLQPIYDWNSSSFRPTRMRIDFTAGPVVNFELKDATDTVVYSGTNYTSGETITIALNANIARLNIHADSPVVITNISFNELVVVN